MIALLCLIAPLGSGCDAYAQRVASPQVLSAQTPQSQPEKLRLYGVAQRVEHRTSRTGIAYDIIYLCDSGCIRVYYPARSAITDGDRVSAIGTFYEQRRVGGRVFRKEMDAGELIIER